MSKHWKWLLPIILFLIIAPWTPTLDRQVAEFFYTPPQPGEKGHFVQNTFLQFLFDYGEIPAWLCGIAALTLLIISFFNKRFYKWKKPSAVYILTFAIGAGIITNAILKLFWERPRPRQLLEFGGFADFHPFWIPVTEAGTEASRSFPCGHCTMGFVFFALFISGLRLKNKWMMSIGLILAITLGVGMSFMRIAQGGHFVSDTLAAALIMWLCAVAADAFLYRKEVAAP